jgi:hypothetical protein
MKFRIVAFNDKYAIQADFSKRRLFNKIKPIWFTVSDYKTSTDYGMCNYQYPTRLPTYHHKSFPCETIVFYDSFEEADREIQKFILTFSPEQCVKTEY